jgi:hypothetical protein
MVKRLLPVLILLLYACAGVQQVEGPSLKIQHVSEIPQSAYFHYKDYIADGKVYVMVHPGYYLYYQRKKLTPENASKELLEFFQHQIRTEEEFFRFARNSGELVVIVVPGKRLKRNYVAYLNRLTGGAPNFVYISSRNYRTGDLPSSEEKALEKFLRALGVREVIVGGGYVGRCESKTYRDLLSMKDISIAISPEISFFSPSDITEATVRMLREEDGTVNITVLNRLIENVFMKARANLKANIKNLFLDNQFFSEQSM